MLFEAEYEDGLMGNLFWILSIDGGGIRGIFSAQILKRIQEEMAIGFSDKFDIIAGTSNSSLNSFGNFVSPSRIRSFLVLS